MRNTTWPAVLLLLLTLDAAAQRRTRISELPVGNFPSGIDNPRMRQKLAAMINARPGAILNAQKTTAGNERLLAEASYSSLPSSEDSIVFIYSGGRSSEFNFDGLFYDYNEANADYYPIQFGNYGYVNYDSVHFYDTSGSYGTPSFRSYNAAGKVTRSVIWTDTVLFSYDAAGRLKTSEEVTNNRFPYRDFYFYNAAGHLVKDSTELWDSQASAWVPDGTYYHTVNAGGYPTKSELVYISGSAPITVFESNNTYNGLNQVTGSLLKIDNGTGLRNYSRDTIGYAGDMKQYRDRYNWDTVTNSWTLSWQERGRMNAAGLPDSVWSQYRYIYNPTAWDTTIHNIAYNAQNNPVKIRSYYSGWATFGYRWYYEPITNVGVKPLPARADLLVYPNPANGMLNLKGVTEGSYSIQNMAGQVLQSGTLKTGSVPVGMLAPGLYSISLIDGAGVIHTARFVRQ